MNLDHEGKPNGVLSDMLGVHTHEIIYMTRPLEKEADPEGCQKCDAAKLLNRKWKFCPNCGKKLID